MTDDYDPDDNSRKCYDLWMEVMRTVCTRPDGSFDRALAERLINKREIDDAPVSD